MKVVDCRKKEKELTLGELRAGTVFRLLSPERDLWRLGNTFITTAIGVSGDDESVFEAYCIALESNETITLNYDEEVVALSAELHIHGEL